MALKGGTLCELVKPCVCFVFCNNTFSSGLATRNNLNSVELWATALAFICVSCVWDLAGKGTSFIRGGSGKCHKMLESFGRTLCL